MIDGYQMSVLVSSPRRTTKIASGYPMSLPETVFQSNHAREARLIRYTRCRRGRKRHVQKPVSLPRCHEAREVARALSLTQLAQRLRLDLANTFARDGKQSADLFESAVGLLPDPETHPQDLLFAGRQHRQDLACQLTEITPDRRLDR